MLILVQLSPQNVLCEKCIVDEKLTCRYIIWFEQDKRTGHVLSKMNSAGAVIEIKETEKENVLII